MTAIDLNAVRATIEGRLKTELKLVPPIPVVFNNTAFDSVNLKSFVQCQISFGANVYLSPIIL